MARRMRVPRSGVAGIAGTFVLMMAATLPYPLLDAFVVDRLGTGTFAPAAYVSVNLIAYVVAGPLAGRWVDRTSRPHRGLVVGMLGQGALLGVQPWVGGLAVLLPVRFLEGGATMVAMTALHATVLADRGTDRGTGAGVIGLGLALGVAAGSAFGGVLGDLRLWAPFVLGAAVLGASAIVAGAWRPRAGDRGQRSGPGLVALLRETPDLWVPVGFSFADRLTVGFLVTALPLTLASVQGFAPWRIGLAMTVFLLAFGAGQVPAGRLSERWGRWAPIGVGSLAYGALIVAIPFAGGAWLWAVLVGAGLSGAVMFAPSLALTGDLSVDVPGRGVALFHQAGSLGFAIGPLGAGGLLGFVSAGGAFLVAGLVEVVAAFVLLAVAWSRSRGGAGLLASAS